MLYRHVDTVVPQQGIVSSTSLLPNGVGWQRNIEALDGQQTHCQRSSGVTPCQDEVMHMW